MYAETTFNQFPRRSITVQEQTGMMAEKLFEQVLTMRSLLKLRIINFIGSLFFVIYGLLIGRWLF